VYWGPHIGTPESARAQLEPWNAFLEWEECEDVTSCGARLLAEGAVIGWARGRSEFGPRALGNRSIFADPRPPGNKERVNELVKKRESFRPFAPAVLAEAADKYFEIPETACPLDYMSCVVRVRADMQHLLGAVTHVDGTARIQVVRRKVNEHLWRLIQRFADLTGVPVVLNTSFNNHAEPIVQSVTDAITCFLTTELDFLIVGDVLVRRKNVTWIDYLKLAPRLAPQSEMISVTSACADGAHVQHRIYPWNRRNAATAVSTPVHTMLQHADGRMPLSDLLHSSAQGPSTVAELLSLWDLRLVTFQPSAA
jgi:Carbamoyltransferase C-terminus